MQAKNNEILQKLKTPESKVAFNIRVISIQLYRACRSIDQKVRVLISSMVFSS